MADKENKRPSIASDQMAEMRAESDRLIANGFAVTEDAPTYTLDQQIAEARASMGEARWNELNAEWMQ